MQRSLFEEDADADIAAVEAQLGTLLSPEKKKLRCIRRENTVIGTSSTGYKNYRTGINRRLPGLLFLPQSINMEFTLSQHSNFIEC